MRDTSTGGVRYRASAKVNLHLGVGAPRGDGYHPLDTVFHAVSLVDDLRVGPGETGAGPVIRLTAADHVDLDAVPTDRRNLVHAAVIAVAAQAQVAPDVRIDLHKTIPVAGGLAGGSADAAATLVALDRWWGLDLSDLELLRLAAGLGSDVPFALLGGTARGTGRGEVLQRISDPTTWWWVLVTAAEGLSTPAVYRRYDELFSTAPARPSSGAEVEAAVASGEPSVLARALHNDLEPAAIDLRPELGGLLDRGQAAGALRGIVSGSGPTCAFLCVDGPDARGVAAELTASEAARGSTVLVATGAAPGVHAVTYDEPA